jgi:hypothetical protein
MADEQNLTAFVSKDLEHKKARDHETKYGDFTWLGFCGISTDTPVGAESVTYSIYDTIGTVALVRDYSKDFPMADTTRQEFTNALVSLGNGYQYTIKEVRAAAMMNTPLPNMKRDAAIKTHTAEIRRSMFFGVAGTDLTGLINNPNIPSTVAPNGAGGQPQWSTKTAQEILDDMQDCVDAIDERTDGTVQANTLLLDPVSYNRANKTKLGTGGEGYSVLRRFQEDNPGVEVKKTNAVSATELAKYSPGTYTGTIMMAYNNNPDTVYFELPMLLDEDAPMKHLRSWETTIESRVGPVVIVYPFEFNVYENI